MKSPLAAPDLPVGVLAGLALTLGVLSNTAGAKAADAAEILRDPILYVVREQYRPDHHNTATFFPRAQHEYNNGQFTPGGALKVWHPARNGDVRTLLSCPEGVIRDPDVHFSGERILFSMRRNLEDSYHLYEVRADGTGLRQLTFARDVDDLDPIYLPDDTIVFSSTREPKYCMCNRHIMANLYRMEADGANIHQIGKSTLFEGHANLMPDGRILYDRWEYVDRNFGDAQGLWTSNPDGTSHTVYWGNNTPAPGAVLEGRIVPGTEWVLCVFSSCHDRPWGALALVDRRRGLDGRTPVLRTWPADAVRLVQDTGWEVFDAFQAVPLKYEDPYPLDAEHFLCSRMTGQGEEMGLVLASLSGDETLVHTDAPGCFDPMPLAARPRPPRLSTRRDFRTGYGTFFVQDVYRGSGMAGVPRGSVKYLRVVESPEKRTWTLPSWNGQGQEAPAMNWHDFNNKRILGTVAVEADGSAYFEVPADTFVYFQLLDADGQMVQSMRSGTLVQSGETAGCVGCHESRLHAPPVPTAAIPAAGRRPVAVLNGWNGPPRLFSYRAEIQPIFDQHCVKCHDYGEAGGEHLILAGDRDLVFNASYNELWRRKLISAIGAGSAELSRAETWGARKSRLMEVLRQDHHEVALSAGELERIATWIDLNAPYYPSYASAHPENLAGRSPLDDRQLERLETLTGVSLRKQADHRHNPGPLLSFDRPELSPCLSGLDPLGRKWHEALAIIRNGAAELSGNPEADHGDFMPGELDLWREAKYSARRAEELRHREAIRLGRRVYDREAATAP